MKSQFGNIGTRTSCPAKFSGHRETIEREWIRSIASGRKSKNCSKRTPD